MAPPTASDEEKRAEEKAVLERLTALIVEKRRPAVLPRLPGNGRTSVPDVYKQSDPMHGTWGAALLEGALAAANDVRRGQSRALLSGSDSLLRRVLAPLERRCATDDPDAFLKLAHEYDIEVPAVRLLRHNVSYSSKENALSPPRKKQCGPVGGLPRSPLSPLNPSIEEAPAEPAATRAAAARAETEAEAAIVAKVVGELSPSALGALGAQLSSEQIAAIFAGHAAAPAKAEPLFAEATRALSTTQRAQLASAAPLQEPRVIKAMTAPPSSALARATCAAAQLDEPGVLELLDAIGERAPFEEGDGRCLRLAHVVLSRICEFGLSADGTEPFAPVNFLRTLLETYGADDGPRLPLGTVLCQFIYYATRMSDDAHWGQNACRVRYDPAYLECMRDIKHHAGNPGMTVLRGPMFSNMVASGEVKRGRYYLSDLSEDERRERLFFGFAIPSVRAMNDGADDDVIDGAGVCPALEKGLRALGPAWHAQLMAMTGEEYTPLEGYEEVARAVKWDDAYPSFDPDAARLVFSGGVDYEATPVFPKMPKDGWPDGEVPWFAQTLPEPAPTEAEPAGDAPAQP